MTEPVDQGGSAQPTPVAAPAVVTRRPAEARVAADRAAANAAVPAGASRRTVPASSVPPGPAGGVREGASQPTAAAVAPSSVDPGLASERAQAKEHNRRLIGRVARRGRAAASSATQATAAVASSAAQTAQQAGGQVTGAARDLARHAPIDADLAAGARDPAGPAVQAARAAGGATSAVASRGAGATSQRAAQVRDRVTPDVDLQALAEEVRGVPGVVRLAADAAGTAAAALPGRVRGVSLDDDELEVHVVADYGTHLPALLADVLGVVRRYSAGRTPVAVVADVIVPDQAPDAASQARDEEGGPVSPGPSTPAA